MPPHPRSTTIFQNPDDMAFFTEMGLVDHGRTALIRGSGVSTERFVPGRAQRSAQTRSAEVRRNTTKRPRKRPAAPRAKKHGSGRSDAGRS